jgi:hypothetical protein
LDHLSNTARFVWEENNSQQISCDPAVGNLNVKRLLERHSELDVFISLSFQTAGEILTIGW